MKQGRAGRILVKNNMESQDDPSIYVVGDVSLVDQDGTGKGQPQIVQGAEATALTALTNIEA